LDTSLEEIVALKNQTSHIANLEALCMADIERAMLRRVILVKPLQQPQFGLQ